MSQVPTNTPIKDIAAGRVTVFADREQWDRDRAQIEQELEALGTKLKTAMKDAVQAFRDEMADALQDVGEKLDGLKDRIPSFDAFTRTGEDVSDSKIERHAADTGDRMERQSIDDKPARERTTVVELSEADRNAIEAIGADVKSVASIMAQRG